MELNDLKARIMESSVEMPLGALLELVSQLMAEYTVEQSINVDVRLVQSGSTIHLYSRLHDDESFLKGNFPNDNSGSIN